MNLGLVLSTWTHYTQSLPVCACVCVSVCISLCVSVCLCMCVLLSIFKKESTLNIAEVVSSHCVLIAILQYQFLLKAKLCLYFFTSINSLLRKLNWCAIDFDCLFNLLFWKSASSTEHYFNHCINNICLKICL